MIDLVKFDKWLQYRRYITRKEDRKKIISIYKRLLKENKNILDFENEVEKIIYKNTNAKMQFDYELTIADISKYLIYENYRRKENEKVEKFEGNC
jgi:hypothetical protein